MSNTKLTALPSRRAVLAGLATSTVAAGLCTVQGCGVSGSYGAGNVAALSAGQLLPIDGTGLAIGRDADGVYAMTTICTHLSCDMATLGTVTPDELDCSCHGSRFDGSGAVLTGPATQPLSFFEVTVDGGGELTINADSVVDPTARLTV